MDKVKVYINGRFVVRQLYEDYKGLYIRYSNRKAYVVIEPYSDYAPYYVLAEDTVPYN